MNFNSPLLPQRASSIAGSVDLLMLFLLAVSVFFSVLIFFAVFYFAIRYRRRSEDEIPQPVHGSMLLEVAWSVIPLGITMIMFAWGGILFYKNMHAPDHALEIYVTAKQWMWKIQHPDGQREINNLHVPTGRPVKLIMTSEDVLHSFFIPAFRVKYDVLPNRYTSIWFEPTRTGTYHLFCAEYCGTQHSGMRGTVTVLEPRQYEQWLAGNYGGEPMTAAGERLFQRLGCATCHRQDNTGRGPALQGVFNRPVKLVTGETVLANEDYLRESILRPNAKLVAGYQPVMPTFQGQINEEGLLQIISYVKSLATPAGAGGGEGAAPAAPEAQPAQPQRGAAERNR
jgi:cytochrome c oxidase subunit II